MGVTQDQADHVQFQTYRGKNDLCNTGLQSKETKDEVYKQLTTVKN